MEHLYGFLSQNNRREEETSCSSKDEEQPQINGVLTGPDTSKKGGKTKEDKKEDQAAVSGADQNTSNEGKTKGDKKKDEAAEGKTKGGKEKGQAAEKPPCSSKDKDQPQRDEVSKGTDQGTSKDEEKTKGDAKKDEAAEKAPNTSLKRERIDGNEQIKSVQDSGTAPCDSTEEALKNKKEVSAATCRAVEGGTYVSEDNKELNQLHSGEGDSNVTEMKLTLPRGFSVDSRDATGRTPLMNAALNGNVQVVKSIMNRGADPSLMDNRGWNTLHLAAQSGDTHILSLIHSYLPNIESKTGEGYTPLMVAATHGKLHAVKWFLEKGANVACECNRGGNTLHYAAQGGDTDVISLIHTHLPNIESKTGEGYTPLMVVALTGKLHAVKWFLEKGATVAGVCNRGWNTLHLAAQGGDTDVISLIHTLLPNIESKTGEGYTPLMVAAFRGKLHAVKWFLEKGATVACESNRGRNTLHCAAQGGDTDIISLIHTHLPNIESKTGDGHTPLMVAVFAGKLHAVKWFLEKGATVAWNVLNLAAFCSDPDIIDLILTHLSHVP